MTSPTFQSPSSQPPRPMMSDESQKHLIIKDDSAPSPVAHVVDGDNQPRYTTKRLRDEIAKAKAQARREAFEDAAKTLEAHPGREFFTGESGRIEWRLSSRADFASAIRAMQSATATEGE